MSSYGELTDIQQFASRVIADHARSTAFAIADGILPGNEGRNYVLRKIMRRAIYQGREHLGLTDPFFYKVCNFVVDEMSGAYPELESQRDFIAKMVKLEEERFGNTMTAGLGRLNEMFSAMSFQDKSALMMSCRHVQETMPKAIEFFKSGAADELFESMGSEIDETTSSMVQGLSAQMTDIDELAFLQTLEQGGGEQAVEFYKQLARLYDTFGTPRDLMRVKLEEFLKVPISEEEFNEKFDAALGSIQQQSGIGQTTRKSEPSPVYAELLEKVGSNKFHGYDATQITDAKIVGILVGDSPVEELGEGEQGSVVLDNTPFYAEAGGQVGDTGILVRSASDGEAADTGISKATVSDTYSPVPGLIIHKVTVAGGPLRVGDEVVASVDVAKRDATRRNHTATHLLHAALREVLGTHVKQAGSVVAPTFLRFDFTHYQPLGTAEIAEIEDMVNRYILQNDPVNTNIMAIEEAMAGGAMALFGEKYGSDVRVLSVGDGVFSKELCGGTHVRATGDIGTFKIVSDEAIASGVRRIRAITGLDAFNRFREDERLIDASLGALKTQRDNLPNAIERLQEELKRTRKEMEALKLKIATGGGSAAGGSADADEARDVAGVKVLGKIVEGLDANGTRQLSDTLLARLKSGVVVLGRKDEGKVGITVRVSKDLTGKVRAGEIIREISPIVGGRGGGRPDMAEGGGTEPDKLGDAIEASYAVVEKMVTA
jgi:alanyl-tRNA synthetase